MKVKIYPSELKGTVDAPRSKSAMQRACALALIKQGRTTIQRPGASNDDKVALAIIEGLGAKINKNIDGSLDIISQGVRPGVRRLSCGESGLSIRMFTPIIATLNQETTIEGEGSLRSRPMHFFDTILPCLGASVSSSSGRLPLIIKGPIHPQTIEVEGSLSSQYITGLLIAFASIKAEGVSIEVNNLKSIPYIHLTLQMMHHFGYTLKNDHYKSFSFSSASYERIPQEVSYEVEGDWSGASFLLVAGAIAGSVEVKGLEMDSVQADKSILEALKLANVDYRVSHTNHSVALKKSTVKAFDFDATHCPDLFPPLVALAAYAEGSTHIKGVHRLTHKESNRADTLQEEFGKMGVSVRRREDVLIIDGMKKGKQGFQKANLHSHNDHRIAMAIAVAALGTEHTYEIDRSEAIDKSYPDFYKHIISLDARCEIIA